MCSRSEVTAASEISHRRAGRTRGKRVKEKKKKAMQVAKVVTCQDPEVPKV